jgi:predicted nucleic acid-binding protein
VRTAIDSNVISAIWTQEQSVPRLLLQLEESRQQGALIISPFVFAELHAYPGITESAVQMFLEITGIVVEQEIEKQVWTETAQRYAKYATRRRQSSGVTPRRILADFLIGAHALVQAERLMTLDADFYRKDFPELQLL